MTGLSKKSSRADPVFGRRGLCFSLGRDVRPLSVFVFISFPPPKSKPSEAGLILKRKKERTDIELSRPAAEAAWSPFLLTPALFRNSGLGVPGGASAPLQH